MAEDTNLEIEDSGNSKKKLIIIIVAVVLVAVIAVVGYLLLFSADTENNDNLATDAQGNGQTIATPLGTALYVAMPRPFIFNIRGSSRDRVVQINVQLLVRGEINEETTKKHIPLIEGTLLGVFSATTVDELSTSAGKETLRFTALEKVQGVLQGVEGSKVIERVLFTGFVMQ